jgi:hypothetical protein
MKQFLFSVLFLFSVEMQAQTYQPFPTENAEWREKKWGIPQCSSREYVIKTAGDTLINGIQYVKLNYDDHWFRSDPIYECCDMHQNEYYGAYREANKRVYFCLPNSNSETLLYDFSTIWEVGQTVNLGTQQFTVASIDSVAINGIYRRRYTANWSSMGLTYQVIEGIGSNQLTFEPNNNMDFYKVTICHKQNENTVWQHDSPYFQVQCPMPSCVVATENKAQSTSISIIPNPTTDLTRLDLPPATKPYEVQLYNLYGQLVGGYALRAEAAEFSVATLPTGVYLCKVSYADKLYCTVKVVVMR